MPVNPVNPSTDKALETEAAARADGAALMGADAAAEALRRGPRGALAVSLIAVGLLFLGWVLFYFLLFMRRGPIG
jgi:hypothetical protein